MNCEAFLSLSDAAIDYIMWWENQLKFYQKNKGQITLCYSITTDASDEAFSSHSGSTDSGEIANTRKRMHIKGGCNFSVLTEIARSIWLCAINRSIFQFPVIFR